MAYVVAVMSQVTPNSLEVLDPRVIRTRRMLADALTSLLKKKRYEEITVQDVAKQATLNRHTFYLHYQDKTALLIAMTELRFRDLLEGRGISPANARRSLQSIALSVCDYLVEVTNCSVKGALIPLDRSIVPVLEALFFERARNGRAKGEADTAMSATTAAWAIFGAARRWHQVPAADRTDAKTFASELEIVVSRIFRSPI